MTNKEAYHDFCKNEPIPIFSQNWWLDIVAGDRWDVVTVTDKGGNVIGSMPYLFKNKFGVRVSGMPILTQKLGPYIKYPVGQKYDARLSHEKKVMNEMINALPKLDRFHQNWDFNYTNWLPFYWEGFSQSTRYTYILDLKESHDITFTNYRGNIRREIKKANKLVEIDARTTLQVLYEMHSKTFSRQGSIPAFTYENLEKIDKKVQQNANRAIFSAKDINGDVHAALYLLLDEKSKCAYYLIGGGDPNLRNSGATSLIMDEAIKYSRNEGMELFDFEGSMIEPIEVFFRGFGSKQTPYFEVRKYSNKWLRFFDLLRK